MSGKAERLETKVLFHSRDSAAMDILVQGATDIPENRSSNRKRNAKR
jgi:hypothetical protein